jgi:hypothetical protein
MGQLIGESLEDCKVTVIIEKQTLKVHDPGLPIWSGAHFPRSLCGSQR